MCFFLDSSIKEHQRHFERFLKDVVTFEKYAECVEEISQTPHCALVIDTKAGRLYKYTAPALPVQLGC